MEYTTYRLYYKSEFWEHLREQGFLFLESINEVDDELLLYINNRLSQILPNEESSPRLTAFYLNLFRATAIKFKTYIEQRIEREEYNVFSYSGIVEEELKHLTATDDIQEDSFGMIAEAIMYAVYVYYTINDKDDFMLRGSIVCENVPKHLEGLFCDNDIDNYKYYRYFDKHILYINYKRLDTYLTTVIGMSNDGHRFDNEAVESYCRERLPYYKSFLDNKPYHHNYVFGSVPNYIVKKSRDNSNDLSASLLQCIKILEERINYIELRRKEYVDSLVANHPSIEEILKDYPKLAEAKRDILVALEKGYIEYTPGKKIHQPGLLTPRIGTSEPSFPSKTAFIFFIGHSLRIDGGRNKRFPASQVASLFVIGNEDTVGTSWRQLSPSSKMELEKLYNTIIN